MTIKIQRGRQFLAGDATTELFDRRGRAGSYMTKASEKLVEQGHTVLLRQGSQQVKLATADDWKRFLAEHASTKDKTAEFASKFGITFDDFTNLVDDVAAGDAKGLTLNLSPRTSLSKALSLDRVEGDYGRNLKPDQVIKLTGAGGVRAEAKAEPSPIIGPEILSTPIVDGWQRDRTEQEAWADFKVGNGSNGIFARTNAAEIFYQLYEPSWDNPEAMAMVERFTMPMKIEVTERNPDGTPKFKDRDEMFRETYYDDPNGALERSGASVRARVRFDDNEPYTVRRVLIQGKKGREVDANGNSAVHKFEKRFEGTFSADEAKANELLRQGKDVDGSNLKVAQLLYKHAKDTGTLSPDGKLQLEPKTIVLQKRRRTHLQFENVSDVQRRRTALQQQIDARTQAGQPVPEAMTRYAAKLDEQIAFLNEASTILRRNGQSMPSNFDAFIISADRYSVYDPSARTTPPNDIGDEVGRVGRGLHLEAEWDTAASDPFEKAMKSINEKLAASPAPADKAQLEADLKRLKEMSAKILADVEQVVQLMKERMIAAGLEPDDRHASKEERAAEFMRRPDRPVIWN
jgi:uncharacterized protein YwgA